MESLNSGRPLEWEYCKKWAGKMRHHATTQFINIWRIHHNYTINRIKFNDETNYFVAYTPPHSRIARLSLRAPTIQENCHERLKQL